MEDKPVHFQAVSNLLYVLTEKSVLYRINCETRAYERIQDKAVDYDQEDELRSQVQQISGGTDFIVTLRSDGQLFATGKNA